MRLLLDTQAALNSTSDPHQLPATCSVPPSLAYSLQSRCCFTPASLPPHPVTPLPPRSLVPFSLYRPAVTSYDLRRCACSGLSLPSRRDHLPMCITHCHCLTVSAIVVGCSGRETPSSRLVPQLKEWEKWKMLYLITFRSGKELHEEAKIWRVNTLTQTQIRK
ncbi:hypothetical protein AAHA92_21398 [Salvia divinorum]|uniref:Uncharacterized protein n=1 Tax=Salvia divinorum TaxID=28513 RepID=A0ABD1GKB5_SALDI